MTTGHLHDKGQGLPPVRAELTRVSLRIDQFTPDGRRIAAGATGTVVDVLTDGEAYIVEFTRPIQALVTVEAQDVADTDER